MHIPLMQCNGKVLANNFRFWVLFYSQLTFQKFFNDVRSNSDAFEFVSILEPTCKCRVEHFRFKNLFIFTFILFAAQSSL